ncbi:VOC family protein [Caldicellulosiruptor changbaiensis]|uniref:VOC family protein n=1 Tax=Caldicellulosiruptor changbaiensis TaxID=1222016 RepID=A0A3T0D691_9FIRM|nr:VOC family protein [Caldicellulosiruptor changbaiensis]AZT90601.1 VOC family protein [Caldicellulosiruptor changbaiensis]
MKKLVPEIHLKNCTQALEFYKNVFGAEVKNVQMTDNVPTFQQYKGKVLHAELFLSPELVVYLADKFDDKPDISNIHLVLECESEEEIKRIYNNLAEHGSVKFELQKTFWGALHAAVTDKFGVTWGLNYSLK